MGLSTTHLLILVAVIVLLFGRNKLSDLMGDVGRGIKSFKNEMAETPAIDDAQTSATTATRQAPDGASQQS